MTRVRVLVAVAVGATGVLSWALAATPGPAARIALAASGTVAAVAAGLALRILLVLGRSVVARSSVSAAHPDGSGHATTDHGSQEE